MLINLDRGLFTFETVLKEPLPAIDWDVEPLIAHGNRVVVYGEFGCGKSWALLDLAIHLALGQAWLDRYTVPQPRSVLYLDEEMAGRTLRTRLKKLANGLGLPDSASIPLWLGSHLGVKLTAPSAIESLLSTLKARDIDPDVIIVETLRRVIGGSENEAEDVGRMWEAAEPLLKADKTLILSHHMRKPGPNGAGSTRHKASGSTDILAGADAGFAVTRSSKDSMIIECVKSRVIEEPPAFTVGLFDLPDQADAVELRYLATKEEIEKDPKLMDTAVEQIREHVEPGKQYRTGELQTLLTDAGFTPITAERAVRVCVSRGVLAKVERGIWQVPEPAKAA
jgi:hypothetical protein